jgi:hypothetical protein
VGYNNIRIFIFHDLNQQGYLPLNAVLALPIYQQIHIKTLLPIQLVEFISPLNQKVLFELSVLASSLENHNSTVILIFLIFCKWSVKSNII